MKRYNKFLFLFSLVLGLLLQGCMDEFGEDPFADPVDKFLGNWRVEESSTLYGGGYVYSVTITRNPDNSAEILIPNFYSQGANEKARALITGNGITIIKQKICDNTIEVQGSGTFVNGSFELNYTANTGADHDVATATYTRP